MPAEKKGVPENSSVIIPRLFCKEPAREIDFCVSAFEAVELGRREGPHGAVVHALLTIRDEMIMIDSEWPTLPSRVPASDGSSPVVIFLYVEDVDLVVGRASELGADVLVPAQDQFWGDRIAWIMDPSGHVWTSPPESKRPPLRNEIRDGPRPALNSMPAGWTGRSLGLPTGERLAASPLRPFGTPSREHRRAAPPVWFGNA